MSASARKAPFRRDARQLKAADPARSVWVSANAGSGKTTVLVDRVLRLLLDGVAPGRILCLTFTRAAAANMSNRVFAVLARWATLTPDELRDELAALFGAPVPAATARLARQSFARALETPGGLKIETIHGFCTRVLQSAPFEANVPARFGVLDDAERDRLMEEARRQVLAQAVAGRDRALATALARVARDTGETDFDGLVRDALQLRLRDETPPLQPGESFRDRLAGLLGIPPGLSEADVEDGIVSGGLADADIEEIARLCAASSSNDRTFGEKLTRITAAADRAGKVAAMFAAFFTQAGTPTKTLVTKAIAAPRPDIESRLKDEQARLAGLGERLKAAAALERTAALFSLTEAVIAGYERRKMAASALDYDDIIARTRELFRRAEAAWILFKLDDAIDHVLVDEAQDNSRAQWEIVRAITAEFTAGRGAREDADPRRPRTLFAVGDEKQSIFGFQGAAPSAFDTTRRTLEHAMRGAGLAFDFVPLNLSFRSTPDVLSAVDAVFEEPDHARGLTSEPGLPPQRHEAVRRGALGAVDIWPLAAPDEAAEADPWDLPVDLPKPSSPVTRLSERIARTLKRWSEAGRDDLGRPFAPGDAMILVRNRGPLFEAINRAMRDAGLPTAGADRLKIGRHIAVLDLMAAARVAVFPRDDLMLAGLLKSPLVGLDDDDLITLAPARQGSLREALSEAAQADPGRFGAADAFIEEIRALAARSGPFAFFARLAGPGGGRRKLIGRLGPEAGDAIDALMAQALAEETRGSGSLVRFIETMARSEAEIRRDLDETAGLVRVLTVHGAKGLEAPVVILADIGKAPETRKLPRLLRLMASDAPDATVLGHVWSPRKGEHPAAALEALEIARLREEEEHRRLLYVAMTRAMDRLIVAGHIGAKGKIDGSWRAMIEAGLAAKGGLVDVPHPLGDETVRRWRQGGGSETGEPASRAGTQAPERPDWIDRPAPAEPGLSPPLRPSRAIDAADAAARPLEDPVVADALAAGAFAHLALEVLPAVPAQRRREAAAALARARGGGLAPERLERLVADILALIDRPDLAGLFGPGSLPEAPVAGEVTLPDGSRRAVAGRIDRLAVTEDAVIVADFKTGAHVPASAAGLAPSHLAQLAIYRTLIGGLFPGRAVRALLIYTASAAVIEPAAGTLDAALMRVTAA